jgi:16S rRNA (uracil1498-N3)-methyltransferase
MTRRFHIAALPEEGAVRLPPEAVRHLRVLGLFEGDEVVLFDGRGHERLARIVQLAPNAAQAEILGRHTASAEAERDLTLACAVPKGRRMDTLVRMCSELGVRRIVPMITRRSVVKPGRADTTSQKQRRWQRISVSASEQSSRSVVTSVTTPEPFPEFLQSLVDDALVVILHPDESASALTTLVEQHANVASWVLLIGPEGGFTDDEMALAEARGAVRARLTPSVLRVETACVAAAAVVLAAT